MTSRLREVSDATCAWRPRLERPLGRAPPILNDRPALDVVLGEPGVEADHLTFCQAGMPTAFFYTEDTACHHAPCDVPKRIDWPHYAQIARLVLATVDRLADGDLDLRAARAAGCGAP